MGMIICPTCGPTSTEQHPRRADVLRCVNCKEWLTTKTDGGIGNLEVLKGDYK